MHPSSESTDIAPAAPATGRAPTGRETLIASSAVAGLLLAASFCFRMDLRIGGMACSLASILAAAMVSWRYQPVSQAILPFISGLVMLIVGLGGVGELWPSAATCASCGEFQHLPGAPAWVWASAVLAVATVAALAGRFASSISGLGQAIAGGLLWLLGGGSIFYLWTYYLMGLDCGYCLAVHVGILTALALTLGSAVPSWWSRALLTGCGLFALFVHFVPGADGSVPAPSQPPPAALPALQSTNLDDLRSLGATDAPLSLHLVIRLDGVETAKLYTELIDALQPHVNAKRVRLIVHLAASSPSDRALAAHALAASDQASYQTVLKALLGLPVGTSWPNGRTHLPHSGDLLENSYAGSANRIATFLDADALEIDRLHCEKMPAVIVQRNSVGELDRWQGAAIDVRQIAERVSNQP